MLVPGSVAAEYDRRILSFERPDVKRDSSFTLASNQVFSNCLCEEKDLPTCMSNKSTFAKNHANRYFNVRDSTVSMVTHRGKL